LSDCGDAFDRAYCALKHARFLADLGYRWNRRFRLWECAADVLAAKIDALHLRAGIGYSLSSASAKLEIRRKPIGA